MMYRLIPILMLLGAVGLFLGYVQPTYTVDIAALTSEIRDYDAALAAAKQFKEKEIELTQQQATIPSDQLARLDAFLPDSVDNVQLILDLNSLATRSGVQLSEFDIVGMDDDGQESSEPGTPQAAFPLESDDPVESIELSFSATGTYLAFRTFLDGVEASLRPLDIVELSIQDSQTGVYTYDITLRLYWLR